LVAVKHSGNLVLDDIIKIARVMRPRSMARTLVGTVKEILGQFLFVFSIPSDVMGTTHLHVAYFKT
jgi:hypothetical protein